MFDTFLREREIRKALHAISRQRVALILQPGNVLVVECSPPEEEWFDLAVRTCHIRGWVEILHDALPSGRVQFNSFGAPMLPSTMKAKTHYRLTEAGWGVIHRSQAWLIATFFVSVFSLIAGVGSVVVTIVMAASTVHPPTAPSISVAYPPR